MPFLRLPPYMQLSGITSTTPSMASQAMASSMAHVMASTGLSKAAARPSSVSSRQAFREVFIIIVWGSSSSHSCSVRAPVPVEIPKGSS